jgi:hypothetical protein
MPLETRTVRSVNWALAAPVMSASAPAVAKSMVLVFIV